MARPAKESWVGKRLKEVRPDGLSLREAIGLTPKPPKRHARVTLDATPWSICDALRIWSDYFRNSVARAESETPKQSGGSEV